MRLCLSARWKAQPIFMWMSFPFWYEVRPVVVHFDRTHYFEVGLARVCFAYSLRCETNSVFLLEHAWRQLVYHHQRLSVALKFED